MLFRSGVKCNLERGGRYFPESNDAHDIVNALIKFIKNNNVKIITRSEERRVGKELLKTDGGAIASNFMYFILVL